MEYRCQGFYILCARFGKAWILSKFSLKILKFLRQVLFFIVFYYYLICVCVCVCGGGGGGWGEGGMGGVGEAREQEENFYKLLISNDASL